MPSATIKKTNVHARNETNGYMSFESRLLNLYELSPLGYQSLDVNGCFLYVNKAWLDFFGYERENVISHWFGDFLAIDDIERFKEKFSQFKKIGHVSEVEFDMVKKDGTTVPVTVNGTVSLDEKGNFSRTHCIISDHTEQRKTSELLKNTRQQFESIINFLPDPTFAINIKGEVIAWNHAMEALSGITAKDILGQGDYVYALPYYDSRRPIIIDLVLQPDIEIKKHYPFINRDKETLITEVFASAMKPEGKHLWVKASPLYDYQGKIIGAIESTRDITELKNSEHKLKTMYDELKEERSALREKNIALREILAHIEEEKSQITRQLKSNIDRVVMPIVKSLRLKVNERYQSYFELLENGLKDITSPFVNKLELKYSHLSPREIEICNMIRSGYASKDIAASLHISIHTVLKQRQRIRKKLEITHKDTNLTSYLKSL